MGQFHLFVLLSWAWILAWIGGSIWYRKRSGKPIIPRAPDGAVFVEAWLSGRSLANVLARRGGARNGLLVHVADRALTPLENPLHHASWGRGQGEGVAATATDNSCQALLERILGRGVDDSLVRALKARAGAHGRSAEAEHRAILAAALAGPPRRGLAEVLAAMPDVGRDEDFSRVQAAGEAPGVFD